MGLAGVHQAGCVAAALRPVQATSASRSALVWLRPLCVGPISHVSEGRPVHGPTCPAGTVNVRIAFSGGVDTRCFKTSPHLDLVSSP